MKQEDKDLVLRDLCARLPYQVKINCFDIPRTIESISIDCDRFVTIDCGYEHFYHPLSNLLHKDCLPYLRPMSSMKEEEEEKWRLICSMSGYDMNEVDANAAVDWLNAHYFDYRGLIPRGLALPAPEGMYEDDSSRCWTTRSDAG